LWIYDKWDFKPHPVILFDFNRIPRKDPENLTEGIRAVLLAYAKSEEIFLEKKGAIETLFWQLIEALYGSFLDKN
jgi:hypothetical protein